MKYFIDVLDQRNRVLLKLLKQNNYNATEYSFENLNEIEDGDVLVFSPAKKFVENEVLNLHNKINVVCGKISETIESVFKEKNINYLNIMNDEIFTIKNANLTAEGVLGLIIEKSTRSMFEDNVLILGNGRIAKALSLLFLKLGIKYSISSFNPNKFASNFTYSANNYYKYDFVKELSSFNVIVNTIPSKIIEDEMLDKFRNDCLFIETASINCLDSEKVKKFEYVVASALPQKYCVETAGKLMYESIVGENNYE